MVNHSSTGAASAGPGGPVLDAKPYIAHDPRIGYLYVPNSRMTLPVPGGGTYTIAINAAGIRSNREYTREKPPGVSQRIIVLGDSFTAGQYVSNEHRFTEHLERRMGPTVEVINFGLEGTGTDQQLLIYEHIARHYEHDLVILLPFLQNIRRNMVDARESFDPKTLEKIWLPKPRFRLVGGGHGDKLELTGVPVPDKRLTALEVGPEAGGGAGSGAGVATDTDTSLANRAKYAIRNAPGVKQLKQALFRFKPHEPFPEYADANSEAWRLQGAIVRRLHDLAAPRPLVVVPIFYASYVMYRMATNYLDRFNELAATISNPPLHVINVQPHFAKQGDEAVRCFLEPHDSHFSPHGNLVLAEALQAELARRGLIKN